MHRLPNIIRDAVRVTSGLGERHLWVDVLCIVQDDPVMHGREQQDTVAWPGACVRGRRGGGCAGGTGVLEFETFAVVLDVVDRDVLGERGRAGQGCRWKGGCALEGWVGLCW